MSLFSLIAGGVSIHHCFPVPILMLVMMSDSDREFLQELYYQHRNIMYHVARKHFADKPVELEEAISITLERMCRYVKKLREVPSNKMQAYVVLMVENVCRNRLRQIIKEREQRTAQFNDSNLCKINSVSVDPYETLFYYADAKTLLASFQGLSQRDRDLIWMRHVERMDYTEISDELHMNEGAVRTALSRAKNRLEEIAREGGITNDEKQS